LTEKLSLAVELCAQVREGEVTDDQVLEAKPCKQRKKFKAKKEKLELKTNKCLDRLDKMKRKMARLEEKLRKQNV